MNKYLEKIALNASKMRQIAKATGVIPDPSSQWKWAVRQVRDKTGKALTGMALAKAKTGKLKAISNNAYQKMLSLQRKNPTREIGGSVSRSGNLNKTIIGQGDHIRMDQLASLGKPDKLPRTVHTHPSNSRIAEGWDHRIKTKNPEHKFRTNSRFANRMADMSGGASMRAMPRDADITGNRRKFVQFNYKKLKNLSETHSDIRKLRNRNIRSLETEGSNATKQYVSSLGKKVITKLENVSKKGYDPVGDASTFKKFAPNKSHSIIDPKHGIEGLHRISESGTGLTKRVRSVYLQRKPQ